jgi:hypothetical protein
VVTDGPYGETKELFGGYFLLEVATKQEAVEWAKRMPAVRGSKIEVRRVVGEDETPFDDPASAENEEAGSGKAANQEPAESAGRI